MRHKIVGIIAIFSIFHQVSSQYNAKIIDSQLREINENLQREEAKIESLMSNLVEFINLLNSSLASSPDQKKSSIRNFRASLTNLATLLKDLATLDNYWPYANFSTCADANRKVTEIDFDIRQYYDLIANVKVNISQLTVQYSWTVYYYGIALTSLGAGTVNQQKSATVLTTTNSIIVEYYNYIALLARSIVNETVINTYLTLFKQKYCICSTDVPFTSTANLSTLERNIQFVEDPLIGLQNAVLTAATNALNNSKKAKSVLVGSSAPALATIVDQTSTFLGNLVTLSDYTNITWNTVNSCNDLYIRLGYIWFKYFQYLQVLAACNRNMTLTYAHQANINATAAAYRLNMKQLTAVRSLIASIKTLAPLMTNYSSHLSYSVVKMVRLYVDMRIFGDSFCGCRDINATTSTTTTTPTTTSTSTTTTTPTTTTTTTTPTTTTTTTTPTTTTTTTTPTTTTTTTTTTPTTTTTTTPTTTTTTTPTTTTTAIPTMSCALWSTYLGDNAPTINGYSIGTDLSNTVAWIGRAAYTNRLYPGRVQVETGKVNFIYDPREMETKVLREYLVLPSGCFCRFPPAAEAKNLAGLVTSTGYNIGSHAWPNGLVSVALVETNTEWYPSQKGGRVVKGTTTNRMVCESSTLPSAKPTVRTANGACGFWKAYTLNNDPAGNGLLAGTSFDNTPAYVGRGYRYSQLAPGRLDITRNPGVYISYGDIETPTIYPEYLVVPVNCTCDLVPVPAALSRVGLVIVPSEEEQLINLIPLSNNRVSVSKVSRVHLLQWYVDEAGNSVQESPANKVLVCEDSKYQASTTTVAPQPATPSSQCPVSTFAQLIPGQCMARGGCFFSRNQCHMVLFEPTVGNLIVQQMSTGRVSWSSHSTSVPASTKVCMQLSGNLEILDAAGKVIPYESGVIPPYTNTPGSALFFTNGGNLCIQHSDERKPRWCAGTETGRC